MDNKLSDAGQKAKLIYERLRPTLEPQNTGKAVAIHIDSEDYALADSHSKARRILESSHPEGAIVTFTVGPPTANDFAVAYRMLADGSYVECEVCSVIVEWDGKRRQVAALVLERNALLGSELFEGCHLDIEATEGGEVLIEPL